MTNELFGSCTNHLRVRKRSAPRNSHRVQQEDESRFILRSTRIAWTNRAEVFASDDVYSWNICRHGE